MTVMLKVAKQQNNMVGEKWIQGKSGIQSVASRVKVPGEISSLLSWPSMGYIDFAA